MSTIQLQGGLGNQLFQLAFLEYISENCMFLTTLKSPSTIHSTEQYFDTIFKAWKDIYRPDIEILHYSNEHTNMIYDKKPNTCYVGYFQRYEYVELIRDRFISKLCFDISILSKYPDITKKTFIHIRGTDYIDNCTHDIGLQSNKYYEKCIELTPFKDFVVFTNDINYAKKIFPNTPIILESEVDSLFLMSQCAACICANSSFSWWGAYLNSKRPIFMPSKWYKNNAYQGNYYFDGVTVIEID
jgi:hypothetical protein